MPKKYDRCVRKVKRKIRTGKIAKTYKANGRKKTNPYAICKASMKRKSINDFLKDNTIKKVNININGNKATLTNRNGKVSARYGKYKGYVKKKGKDVYINFKKEKEDWLDFLGG